ncbi:MAG: Xaa-Pro peptidase family protein [Alphaproteobacteria bacterium]
MPIFTIGEIERRWAGVRERLGQAQCVVVPSFHNSYYLSGVPVIQWGRWAITILFRDREPVLVIPELESVSAQDNSPIREVRVYRDDEASSSTRTATGHAIAALRQVKPRVIGIEGGGMPAAMARQLQEAFPDAKFPDLTDAIDEVRIISSGEEITYLRAASVAADAGIKAVIDAIRPGIPELTLCATAQVAMAQAIPDGMELQTNCYMQQGLRSFLSHASSTSEPIGERTLVEVVCECQVWHYQAAVERAVLVGEPPPRLRDGYRASVEAFEASRAAIRPGATFEQVHQAALGVLLRSGYERVTTGSGLIRNILHHTSGRIEFGNFRKGNHRKLGPGMVLTIEPWALIPEVGSPRHCDMVLVTEAGQELLSKAPSGEIRVG